MTPATRSTLRIVTMLMVVIGSAASCRDDSRGDPAADDAALTVPTTDPTAQPVPPLPADISLIIYGVGELAAMGNVQATLRGSTRDQMNMTFEFDVVNAALTPVRMRSESFRLYLEDGTSRTPVPDQESPLTASPFASGEERRVTLRFAISDTAEAVMVVFDGNAYGERVSSAAFVLD